jgi:hypothetical protein
MMRTIVIRLLIAAGLAAGAYASWTEADRAERAADASRQIATLQFADVDGEVDPATAATVAYWLGRYGSVTADTTSGASDAYVLRTAANAAFRAYEREPGAGPAAVQRLDGVLQAYASALKASPRDADAAYNYEYVARLRDAVARAKGKPVKPETVTPAPLVAGDLPAGPTIHGRPGAPPPDAKMEELQMLAPMEYGDREAQPEATPGGKRERKG